jgi:phosphatidylinositol phospholipase C, beta
MAKYLIDVFDTNLLVEPLKSHPCDPFHSLPSPNELKYKILIKNKKLVGNGSSVCTTSSGDSSDVSPSVGPTKSSSTSSSNESTTCQRKFLDIDLKMFVTGDQSRQGGVSLDIENASSDDGEIDSPAMIPRPALNSDALPESKATKAMSDLVHYTVPIRFQGFERADARHRSHEMSSFSEDKAHYWLREHSKHFLWYNQRQMSRVYPRGTRFDSGNYFPHPFWAVGCQMIALNYQTLGERVSLSLSLGSMDEVV